jgi:hypothetical protein
MSDDLKTRRQLRSRIQHRRADIDEFLRRARPWRNVLNNATIVFSSLSAGFAAVPAFGGMSGMTAAAKKLDLDAASQVWQPLCIAACVVAVLAAVTANLVRSHDVPSQVSAAEACNAELESLLTMIDFHGLSVPDAGEVYQQCVRKIPFIREGLAPAPARVRSGPVGSARQ